MTRAASWPWGGGHGLAKRNTATQSTPHIGVSSGAGILQIVLFLTFLAFRPSDCNGWAPLWAGGQRCARRRGKPGTGANRGQTGGLGQLARSSAFAMVNFCFLHSAFLNGPVFSAPSSVFRHLASVRRGPWSLDFGQQSLVRRPVAAFCLLEFCSSPMKWSRSPQSGLVQ